MSKGIDIRQSGQPLRFDAAFRDGAGSDLTSGEGTLALYELQANGTLKRYDFNDNTFKTTAPTTGTTALTQQSVAATATGLFTYIHSTLTGFTRGGIYYAIADHASAAAAYRNQKIAFQYGDGEGDLSVAAAGQAAANVQQIAGQAANAAAPVTFPASIQPAGAVNINDNAIGAAALTDAAAEKIGLATWSILTTAVSLANSFGKWLYDAITQIGSDTSAVRGAMNSIAVETKGPFDADNNLTLVEGDVYTLEWSMDNDAPLDLTDGTCELGFVDASTYGQDDDAEDLHTIPGTIAIETVDGVEKAKLRVPITAADYATLTTTPGTDTPYTQTNTYPLVYHIRAIHADGTQRQSSLAGARIIRGILPVV